MILYDNKANSIFLILRRKGSIIWTILIEIFMAVGFALLFVLYQPILLPNFDRRSITNPFALQVSLIITGYQVVFRTNMALWRFWEGCTQVTTMTSRWTQSFSQTRAFLLGSAATAPGTREERLIVTRILRDALRRCATYFTVMHGLAVLELEGNELEHGEEANFDTVPFEEPESQYKKLCKTPGGSFEWVGEPPREYRRSKKPPPLSILGEVTENDAMDLDGTKDNVLMAGMWITEEVSSLVLKGQCRVPPPIISRCYQELSNGMLGFNQALKIKLVPFPFVLAQIASLNLLVVLCGSPMFVHIFTGSPFFTLLFTGIIVLGYYGLNRISIELEDPYGTDENDLPMRSMQLDFCHRLRQSAEMDLPHVEGLELGLIERPSDEQFDEAKRTHRLSLLPPMFDADDAEKLAAAARGAPGPKERINHVLEQLGFKPFPAWLDEALLPSYGLRNLEKKFGDADVAAWVYRQILEAPELARGLKTDLAARLASAEAEVRRLEHEVEGRAKRLGVDPATLAGVPEGEEAKLEREVQALRADYARARSHVAAFVSEEQLLQFEAAVEELCDSRGVADLDSPGLQELDALASMERRLYARPEGSHVDLEAATAHLRRLVGLRPGRIANI